MTEARKRLLRAMHSEGLFEDELLNEAIAEAVAAERARIAPLVEAAQSVVGRFLDTPASLAGVHVAALNDLRAAVLAIIGEKP